MTKPAGKAVSKSHRPASSSAALATFDSYPKPVRSKLLALRKLILNIAKTTKGVGAIEEALKWGQPIY